MMKHILTSLRALVVLSLLTGVIYPLIVSIVAQLLFPKEANGSMILVHGKPRGSELLAQKFTEPRYFWPRPSAADFATVASGASNQGFTSRKLLDAVNERRSFLGKDAPSDLLYASGSGLDPHISVAAARFQAPRVAKARGASEEEVLRVISQQTERPQFGFLGQTRVNVLKLNLALDAAKN